MTEPLFDASHEYDQMLAQGLKLSGEDKSYFSAGRLDELRRRLPSGFTPGRVLDFGCGTGGTTAALKVRFPAAEIVGVDTSVQALAVAAQEHRQAGISFKLIADLTADGTFGLCYVNGVFHHIEPERRPEAAALIYKALRPGGAFAMFENNPWNPGARLVMSRIPFDRDAKPFSPPTAKRLLEGAGFTVARQTSLFYFPRMLAWFRILEPALAGLPLGAQYLTLGLKD